MNGCGQLKVGVAKAKFSPRALRATLLYFFIKKEPPFHNPRSAPALVARSTSRPIFASVMGYRRSLVDTCKNSSVLVVSTLVFVVFLPCFCYQHYVMMNCHCYTLWHVMTHDHVEKWACPRSAGARLSTRETGNEAMCPLASVTDN